MKKIYFLAGAFIFTAGAMAQNMTKLSMTRQTGSEGRVLTNIERAEGDVIWEDDFSNTGNWTTGADADPQNWVIGTAGPSGSFSSTYGTLESTTAANGFALFDSDALGSGTSSQDSWIAWNTTGGTISTSGITAVTLEFESLYSHYQGACYVEISTDGGSSWPNSYQVHQDVPGNTASDNPTIIRLNVSSAAANQADVRIRFRYVGGWDYAWMVDDVKLIETFQNEIALVDYGQRAGNDSVDVYSISTSQKAAFPGWYLGGKIINNGANDQANTRLNVSVVGQAFNEDAPSINLVSEATDTFEVANPYMTTTDGNYEIVFAAAMDNTDALTSNNNDTMDVTVGGFVYARDNGIATGSISNVSSQPGQPLKIGNTFEVFADFNFKGIDLGISSEPLNVDQTVSVEVQRYNPTSQEFEYVTESNEVTILNGMLGAITTFTLNDQVNALAGETLLILARHNGGVDLDSDGNPDEVRFLYAQTTYEGSVLGYTADGNSFQLLEPNAIMIRINEDPTIGVSENGINISSAVYPNPANDVTNINFTLTEAAQVSIEVVDINGKVVYTNNQGTLAAGNYTEVFNTSNLTNGIYYYNFNVNGTVTSNKLVVSHK